MNEKVKKDFNIDWKDDQELTPEQKQAIKDGREILKQEFTRAIDAGESVILATTKLSCATGNNKDVHNCFVDLFFKLPKPVQRATMIEITYFLNSRNQLNDQQ